MTPALISDWRSGYINGTRVMLGTHAQFQPTSCTTQLAFLADSEAGRPDKLRPDVVRYLETQLGSGSVRGGVLGKVSISITYHLILIVRKVRRLYG